MLYRVAAILFLLFTQAILFIVGRAARGHVTTDRSFPPLYLRWLVAGRSAGPGHAAVTPVSHLDWWRWSRNAERITQIWIVASCSEPAAAVWCLFYNV